MWNQQGFPPNGYVAPPPGSQGAQPSRKYPVPEGHSSGGFQGNQQTQINNYPPSQGYPPQSQGFPPQSQGYPPQVQGYPTQSGYPPQHGYPSQGFPPQSQQQIPQQRHQGVWASAYYSQNNSQELQTLTMWFRKMDVDGSGTITANELANVAVGGIPLGIQVSLKLVRIFDTDGNGEIDFQEYAALHKFLLCMQTVFSRSDVDKNGRLDSREIHEALKMGGFTISFNTIQKLYMKFDRTGMGMDMKNFLAMVAHIAQTRTSFEKLDIQRRGQITLNFDQVLDFTSTL